MVLDLQQKIVLIALLVTIVLNLVLLYLLVSVMQVSCAQLAKQIQVQLVPNAQLVDIVS